MNSNAPVPPTVSSHRMLATLGITALLSGILVVSAYEITLPRIEENRRQALEQAVYQVLPTATTHQTFVVTRAGLVPTHSTAPDGTAVHAGYDPAGRLVGIAAEASARGYQDVIQLLYAYSPQCACITGVTVLRNNDTPGIGDKIGKDPAFRANFKALAAMLNPERTALAHAIITVKHGKKVEAWQIDAISGATISSRAVGKALNDSAQLLVPILQTQLVVFENIPREGK